MLEFLAAWAGEIVVGLIATAITSWFIWRNKELKKQLDKANAYDTDQEKKEINAMIDDKLAPLKQEHVDMNLNMDDKIKPLYKELENLRAFERKTRIDSDELKRVLLDSWQYRIKQLCEEHLSHGEISVEHFRQLQEFYGYYTALGGNGVIPALFRQVEKLPIIPE